MTPERKQWWDSLPEREKILRKDLSYLKYQRSKEKERISIEQNGTSKKIILERINCYTVFIRTLKHELYSKHEDEIKTTCKEKGAGLIVDGYPITTVLKPKVRKEVKPLTDNGYIHYLRLFAKKWVRER